MSNIKLSSFVQQVIATIKGDDAQATAIKIQRQAENTLTAQIAVRNSLTYDFEEKVETVRLRIDEILSNKGNLIEDKEQYIRNILSLDSELKEAQEELNDHKASIVVLETALDEVKK